MNKKACQLTYIHMSQTGAGSRTPDHFQRRLRILPAGRAGPLVRHYQHDRLRHLRQTLRLPEPEQEELHHRQVRHQDPRLHQRLRHLPLPGSRPHTGTVSQS